MLVDSHAHLYWHSFKADLDAVLKRAKEAGVGLIVNIGTNLDTSQKALEQANQYSSKDLQIYSTIGIHPTDFQKYITNSSVSIQQDTQRLQGLYRNNTTKIVAIGECGLDYYQNNDYNNHNFYNQQKQLFQAQIDLAKKLNLPLIVHCRDDRSKNPQNSEAWDKVLEMTKDHFGIYHCYSGLLNTTYKILNTNFLVSFAANITYPKNNQLREVAKTIPLDRILIETDAPFLAPQGKRGQRNEPANVLEVAKTIAEVKGVNLNQVAHQTTNNSKALFNIVQ